MPYLGAIRILPCISEVINNVNSIILRIPPLEAAYGNFKEIGKLYTSLENADTQKIADRFGYPTSMVLGIRYEDGNLYKSDNLLSVKYYIGTKEDAMQYPVVAETADYVLYKNENALPFAYYVKNNIREFDEMYDNNLLDGKYEDYVNLFYKNIFYPNYIDDLNEESYLHEVAKYVNKQPIEISMKSETHFEIVCENNAEKELYLLCTIPYDDNWEDVLKCCQKQPSPLAKSMAAFGLNSPITFIVITDFGVFVNCKA